MQRGQGPSNHRVAQSREPACLGRKTASRGTGGASRRTAVPKAAPGRSHRRHARCPTPSRRCSAACRAIPPSSRGPASERCITGGSAVSSGLYGPLVAAEKAADDPRAIGSAAAELIDEGHRRRWASERRHVRHRPHPGDARQYVRIALGENDDVSLPQAERLLADRLSPALTARDEMVFDDPLGARHHFRRNLPRRRRLHHPRRAQVEVEVHRIRSDGPRETRLRGRQVTPDLVNRTARGRSASLADGRPNKSDSRSWPPREDRRRVGTCRGDEAPADFERMSP